MSTALPRTAAHRGRPLALALVGAATALVTLAPVAAQSAPSTSPKGASPEGTRPASTAAASTLTGTSAASTRLRPRVHFTMKPDGSSGRTQGGEGIPNIDVVKKTIAVYYGDPGTGIADKTSSPYIRELNRIAAQEDRLLLSRYRAARRAGEKPALVFDTDDTTLWTYDMEVAAMKFNFDPLLQNTYVQQQRFPATPAMVHVVNRAASIGYKIIGLTGRNRDQKAATLANLEKVGYRGFNTRNFYTKWTGKPGATQPSWVSCAAAACTTVEYKAQTRRHIERDRGYTIVANYGDQWSDLQGGYAEHTVKLPNPTYYLPSPNLPGVHEPELTPRTHFTMKADGSSGRTESGEGIPNIDVVKKTIAVYYGDPGTGIADKKSSPYLREVRTIVAAQRRSLASRYRAAIRRGEKPALVFDIDDTTLWTYDMEVAAMKFNFDPVLQNTYVQQQRFPATPAMVGYVNSARDLGYAVFGLTGRNDDQKTATLANLRKVGYRAFSTKRLYTKWTGSGSSTQPGYVACVRAKCTTVEYKSQTRRHLEDLGYTIIASYGDQWSDLQGGYADHPVKLPNPTYYLP